MPALLWTDRDRALFRALTRRVPFLSLAQITRTWWSGRTPDAARHRLARLAGSGLVWKARVPIHPELPLEEPVVRWQPGQGRPELGAASYQLRARWTGVPRPTLIYRATSLLAARLGGHGGRLGHELHLNHDLHMGTVYLRYLERTPDLAARWLSEKKLARSRRHQKLPDAALRDDEGRISLVVEFGGAYDLNHLAAFHDDCEARELSYEVW